MSVFTSESKGDHFLTLRFVNKKNLKFCQCYINFWMSSQISIKMYQNEFLTGGATFLA